MRESVQENRKGDKRCEILVGVKKYVTLYDCCETENIKKSQKKHGNEYDSTKN